MLGLDLMTEKDRREAAAIEKRRALEEERKKRIFNPRNRLIGIDTDVLKRQVEEKRLQEEEQRRAEKIFQENLVKADTVAVAYERKEREERQKLQQQINEYRKNFQKPEDRREFDLNDPNINKKQLPSRAYDDDPRLGPSSAQKFEGEDRQGDERHKIQREEIRAWLDQQMQEREAAEKERKTADDAYKAAIIARDQRALELDRMERECRRKLQEANVRFNEALAAEKKFQEQIEKKQIKEDNTAEIYNTLTSGLLTEDPGMAQSNLGLGRKITALYKGMSSEEKRRIKEEQLSQIEEAKKNRELEARMKVEMDNYLNGIQKSINLMDKEVEAKRKSQNKQRAEENKRLADEQNSHQRFLSKIVYSNVPTEEFFNQFNKSTR